MNKCRSNARLDGLTPGQERAIRTMFTARSIAAAARQADFGQSTLRRWIREDNNFQNTLRQLREEALSHAALMLQQGASQAVCIMHELIQSPRPIEPGRVSLIRTAIEFAFRAAIYCDIIERVKALEKAQRQNQPAGGNPRPTPARIQPQNGAARVSKRFPLVRDQSVLGDKHFAKPPAAKREFSEICSNLPGPAVKQRRNFPRSAQTCLLRTHAWANRPLTTHPPTGAVSLASMRQISGSLRSWVKLPGTPTPSRPPACSKIRTGESKACLRRCRNELNRGRENRGLRPGGGDVARNGDTTRKNACATSGRRLALTGLSGTSPRHVVRKAG